MTIKKDITDDVIKCLNSMIFRMTKTELEPEQILKELSVIYHWEVVRAAHEAIQRGIKKWNLS